MGPRERNCWTSIGRTENDSAPFAKQSEGSKRRTPDYRGVRHDNRPCSIHNDLCVITFFLAPTAEEDDAFAMPGRLLARFRGSPSRRADLAIDSREPLHRR